ncbi:hypothetical protein OAX78_02690 [Planctomycetota bacterium]|nr:hypothetical protein [Planctomycetota bacterium]
MIFKGLYGFCMFVAFTTLFFAAPKGCSCRSASPEKVQRDPSGPSVRRGSTSSPRYVFIGGGYYGGK